jgi:hypothetical protein
MVRAQAYGKAIPLFDRHSGSEQSASRSQLDGRRSTSREAYQLSSAGCLRSSPSRAVRIGRRDRLVNARQMSRQRAAVDPPFPRCIGGDLPLLLDRLGLGDRLFEIFQRQIELIGMKLGEPLALRLEALRLAQQTTQAVVKFAQPVALGDRVFRSTHQRKDHGAASHRLGRSTKPTTRASSSATPTSLP